MDVAVSVEHPGATQALIAAQGFLDSLGFSSRWLMAPHALLAVARLESSLICGVGVATKARSTAVLMSFAVHPDVRGHRIGGRMAEALLSDLKSGGVESAYLLSKTAGGFWERMGFSRVPVGEVAVRAQDHFQVRQLVDGGAIWNDQAFRRDLLDK